MAKNPAIGSFKGLNNVADPLTLGADWLTVAENVDIGREGRLARRQGYQPTAITQAVSSAYCTRDERRMYLAGADLLRVHDDLSTTVLLEGLAAAPMHWCEVNGQVFFTNGTDSGVIEEDGQLLPWAWPMPTAPRLAKVSGTLPAGLYRVACTFTLPDGRETGASDTAEIELPDQAGLQLNELPQYPGGRTNVYIAPADSTVLQLALRTTTLRAALWNGKASELGVELWTDNRLPLPAGADVLEFHQGRLLAAQYFPAENQTAIWRSDPLAFHLFDLQAAIVVKGRVLGLADAGEALLIGTDTEIHAWTPESMARLADYGLVPGRPITRDKDRRILMWTTRGVCTALPFRNLTEARVSVAPGLQVGASVINTDGQERFVAFLHAGGTAFNPRNP